jgi:hypothetical protein
LDRTPLHFGMLRSLVSTGFVRGTFKEWDF